MCFSLFLAKASQMWKSKMLVRKQARLDDWIRLRLSTRVHSQFVFTCLSLYHYAATLPGPKHGKKVEKILAFWDESRRDGKQQKMSSECPKSEIKKIIKKGGKIVLMEITLDETYPHPKWWFGIFRFCSLAVEWCEDNRFSCRWFFSTKQESEKRQKGDFWLNSRGSWMWWMLDARDEEEKNGIEKKELQKKQPKREGNFYVSFSRINNGHF